MTNNGQKCFGFLGLALGACMVLQLFAARDTEACSPLETDWEVTHSNVANEENGVPINLVLRMELLHWSSRESYIHYESDVDPSSFRMVCNEETVEGAFRLSDGGPLFIHSEIRSNNGKWTRKQGCNLPCESGMVFLQLEFYPEHELPVHASCELTLSHFCTSSGCSDTRLGHEYPRTLVSFETGDSSHSNSLDLGEPSVEDFIYKNILSECKWIGPDLGSCSSCVEVSTSNKWGAVISYPGIQEKTHELQVGVFIADSVVGLATAESKAFLLSRSITDNEAGIALPLGEKDDGPRCIQAVLSDRIGRETTRSAPVCMNPAELSWPGESSGCSAGGRNGIPSAFFGLLFFLVLILLRHV